MLALLGSGLNIDGWDQVIVLLEQRLLQYECIRDHKQISERHENVISIGYKQIIAPQYLARPRYGVVVFHSSDLPRGRGWAPLYYTIVNRERYLTQTMFYADPGVDSGPILAKARYPIDRWMTVSVLRKIDDQLTMHLLENYVEKLARGRLRCAPQDETFATYWPRRTPEDSRINPVATIEGLYDILRALPEDNPAFFYVDGFKVKLKITVENFLEFSSDKIEYTDFTSQNAPKNVQK